MPRRPHLVYVAPRPIRVGQGGLPNRPAALLHALHETGAFASIVVVSRVKPWNLFDRSHTTHLEWRSHLPVASWPMGPTASSIVHATPFGRLEAAFLRATLARDDSPRILWVSDPKSALAFRDLSRHEPTDRWVFDAYDAWDLSPLVRGRWRRGAVADGYRLAAKHADTIFANTRFMQERMQALGSSSAYLLPNAAPGVEEWAAVEPPYLAYLGRIHERFDSALVTAIATAEPQLWVRIAGPLERRPEGWDQLASLPNLLLEGPRTGAEARRFLGQARAVVIPHLVDDYTRSQDMMKAWDAIAVGTPVVSTPLPPVTTWPPGLGITVNDGASAVAAVRRILAGEMDATRASRLDYARTNGWASRAQAVLDVLGLPADVSHP